MNYDVLIAGAGAAGLFCAFHAARRGRRVVVAEHNAQPGRKILISGGGRCNFTNRDTRADCFLSENPHFVKSALARYTPRDFVALVERHGIAWHEKTLGQLFCDGSARQILDMLLAECRAAGVEIRCGVRVGGISRDDGGFEVQLTGEGIRAGALVIATGGPSIPKMGATGFAYDVARQFGLKVVAPRPALVPLTWAATDLRHWGPLAGVAATCRAAFGSRAFAERLLFTHRGLSGPAILQISSYWQPGQPLSIDLAPGLDLERILLDAKRDHPRVLPRTVLAQHLPDRLAAAWATGERPLLHVPDAALRQLGRQVHGWTVIPDGTEGYEKAEVTAGGVDTAELASRDLQSRRVPGLYFIGEAVDVTGWLGGYNFQWAWASAFAAAQSA